ncbi:MAG: hypothetical protein DCC57_13645 [Chloroflexi bacterium]|nr:MAG: hypothetical protein DCC57_13645 [Chloroflexota bacterium]
MWLRWLMVIILIGHGIGHATGFLNAWTTLPTGFSSAPWIFGGDLTTTSAVGKAWGLLWLLALIGFVGAGLGLWFRQPWWLPMASAAAAISLVAVVPWWNTVVMGARVGALVDVAILFLAIFWKSGMEALTAASA